jgi:hypothetical protein
MPNYEQHVTIHEESKDHAPSRGGMGSLHSLGDLALPVFAFYMLILCNFMNNILGCNIQRIMNTNPLVKYLVAYILLLFLVVFTMNTNREPLLKKIMIATAIFIWFIITTRCPASIMITVLILLLIAYLVGQNAQYDPEYIEKKGTSRMIQTILSIIALVLSVVGFVIYIFQHSFTGFFTSTINCSYTQ